MGDEKKNPESAEIVGGQPISEVPVSVPETVSGQPGQPKEPRELVRETLGVPEETDRKAAFLKFLQASFKETVAAMHIGDHKAGDGLVVPEHYDPTLKAKKEGYWRAEGRNLGKKWGYLTLRRTDGHVNWIATEGDNAYIAIPKEKLDQSEANRWIAKGSKRLELVPVEQSVLSSGMLPILPGFTWMAAGSKQESMSYLYAIGYDSGGPSIKSEADEEVVKAIEKARNGNWIGFIMNLAHGKSLSNEAPSEELMLQVRHYATLMMEDGEWKKDKENLLGEEIRAGLTKLEWFADIAREL
jgi:hypothetical protein